MQINKIMDQCWAVICSFFSGEWIGWFVEWCQGVFSKRSPKEVKVSERNLEDRSMRPNYVQKNAAIKNQKLQEVISEEGKLHITTNKVDLSETTLLLAEIRVLAEALKNSPSVQEVSLENCKIQFPCVQGCMSRQWVEARAQEAAKAFGEAIKEHPSLSTLNLNGCRLGDGVESLQAVLTTNTVLRTVKLERTGISDEGKKALRNVNNQRVKLVFS